MRGLISLLTVGVLPALVDVDAAVDAGPARQALALAAPHAGGAVLARVGGGAGVDLAGKSLFNLNFFDEAISSRNKWDCLDSFEHLISAWSTWEKFETHKLCSEHKGLV